MVFGASASAHDRVGALLLLLFVFIVAIVIAFSVSPRTYEYTFPLHSLELTPVCWAGTMLLVASLAWIVFAQAQMHESWRIGIDREHQTDLVQAGVFSVSRNPIFVGMIVTLAGLFLAIPSVATLIVLVVGAALIRIQVALEEQFLAKAHADEYALYRRRVRRWL